MGGKKSKNKQLEGGGGGGEGTIIRDSKVIRRSFNLIKYYLLLFPQHLRYVRRHLSHNFFSRKLTHTFKLQ